MKKYIELPAAEPADGGRGGSVYVRVNKNCNSLLCFHEQKIWRAKKGYHGSAAPSATPGRERRRLAPEQHDLFIDVPPGTVVRRKRTGELLGDLTQHSDVSADSRRGRWRIGCPSPISTMKPTLYY